jgi:hypothetical protein
MVTVEGVINDGNCKVATDFIEMPILLTVHTVSGSRGYTLSMYDI